MTKAAVLQSLSQDARSRPKLPKRELGEHVRPQWAKYRKAFLYEGHELPKTYDPHAHLTIGTDFKVDTARPHNSEPAVLPKGFYDPRQQGDAQRWHSGSQPITIAPTAIDRTLHNQRVRKMKPKAKQRPKAREVLGVVEWDIQYRPDLPADWSVQARKRNWDCLSRHIDGKPTLDRAIKLLKAWRLLDSRIIVDIDDKRRTREVWFKVPPFERKRIAQLGRIADDGISGR